MEFVLLCKSCRRKIGKFERRITLEDYKPEAWGSDGMPGGRTCKLVALDAAVVCSGACLAEYAAEVARLEAASPRASVGV